MHVNVCLKICGISNFLFCFRCITLQLATTSRKKKVMRSVMNKIDFIPSHYERWHHRFCESPSSSSTLNTFSIFSALQLFCIFFFACNINWAFLCYFFSTRNKRAFITVFHFLCLVFVKFLISLIERNETKAEHHGKTSLDERKEAHKKCVTIYEFIARVEALLKSQDFFSRLIGNSIVWVHTWVRFFAARSKVSMEFFQCQTNTLIIS